MFFVLVYCLYHADRYETLGFEKRDRSHLFQTELEDFLVTDTGRYYR